MALQECPLKGRSCTIFFSCSTWSEYAVIDVNYVVKIDPSLNLQHAGFMSCGFSTGFGAAWKEAKVEKGSSVAVIGLGAVGLGAIEGARIQGARRIIGIDINERKKEKGKAVGMTDFINPQGSEKSVSELVKELTGGLGVDYCIECTGVASLVNEGLLSIKMGTGKTIMVGAGAHPTLQVSFLPLLFGATLKGSIFGGLKIRSDLPTIIDKCKNKELHLEELLTHEVKLEEIEKAYQALKQPDCVKVLIKI